MVKVLELQHQSFQWIFRVDFLRIGWFELLGYPKDSQEFSPAVQFKNINSLVQLSYSYISTGKTLALTRWTFVSKVMSLLFNRLSSFLIAILPRSKHLGKSNWNGSLLGNFLYSLLRCHSPPSNMRDGIWGGNHLKVCTLIFSFWRG